MWTYNLDGDPVNPDWEHTMDGDYQPKGITYTLDGDKMLNGRVITNREIEYARNRQVDIE